jgi:hypoxanthine phosphoribosyltransferase
MVDVIATAEVLTTEDVARRVRTMAETIAPRIDDDTVVVCLLTGAIWFAADLMRALDRCGKSPLFDALWLSSYNDGKSSSGVIEVRAGLQRPVTGRRVLLVDDVVESGLSLAEAARMMRAAGATEVLSAVFACKPWPTARAVEPDFKGWDAPNLFLVGYGMDVAGRLRGMGGIGVVE